MFLFTAGGVRNNDSRGREIFQEGTRHVFQVAERIDVDLRTITHLLVQRRFYTRTDTTRLNTSGNRTEEEILYIDDHKTHGPVSWAI